MRPSGDPPTPELGPAATAFLLALFVGTAALVAAVALPVEASRSDWLALAVLLPLIAGTHLLGADRAKYQGSHLSLAPIFAAVLILPPALAALAIAAAFVPEWLRTRADWYIVLFNVCNFVAPALAASVVFAAAGDRWQGTEAVGAAAALAVFLVLQYGLLAVALRLARGVSVSDTVRADCVLVDAGLLSLGAIAAVLWEDYPSLVVLTLVPLALAYRSLSIPALVEATRIEPKTGLYNLRHFRVVLEQELGRAARFDRPVALLMIDVDHLRELNNARGHLAGDRALASVAAALRETTREYDVAARFGGDEFCLLLPETDLAGALVVAGRARQLVEQRSAAAGVPVTVSVGAAAHRGPGATPDGLIALADRATYRAKFSGRNAVAVPPEGDPVDEAERLLSDAARGD